MDGGTPVDIVHAPPHRPELGLSLKGNSLCNNLGCVAQVNVSFCYPRAVDRLPGASCLLASHKPLMGAKTSYRMLSLRNPGSYTRYGELPEVKDLLAAPQHCAPGGLVHRWPPEGNCVRPHGQRLSR